jgi:hypothetical protein
VPTSVEDWTERFAAALDVAPPSEDEKESLLELAATCAHESDRTAAPISCWLAAKSGKSVREALDAAVALVDELDRQD